MSGSPWLNEAAEWSGHWWLPDAPGDAHPGVLSYSPESGLTLTLIGGFESRIWRQEGPGTVLELDGSRKWDVVLGVADNKEITLLDCIPINSKHYGFGLSGPDRQSITARTALEGVHLADEAQCVFTGARVSFEGLTTWSGDSLFTLRMSVTDDKQLTGEGSVEVAPVPGHQARYKQTTIRLEQHHTMPSFEHRRGSTLARMSHSAVLCIDPDDEASFAVLQSSAVALQDLLSLATHRASAMLWFKLRLPPEAIELPEGFPDYPPFPREVSVYSTPRVVGAPEAKISDWEGLFTLDDIPFEHVIPKWLEIRDRFTSTVNLMLGLRYVPGGYVETQLSQAVTAAEAMHRALDPDPPIPSAEFKLLKATVLAAVPADRKAWASGLLARNEHSLKMRLLDLAGRPDSEAMQTLLPDPAHWAKMTTRSRNELFHTGTSTAHEVEDLFAVSRVTTAVVLLNLLHEIGLPGEKQLAILSNNSQLSMACKLSRTRCVAAASAEHA